MIRSSTRFAVGCGAAALGIFALALMAVPPGAAGFAFTPQEQKCRDAMAKGGAKLGQAQSKALSDCHRARDKGKINAGTDCNDLGVADTKGKASRAEQKLTRLVGKRCSGQSAAFLGYTSCPAPCMSEVPSIADMSDAADCLACLFRSSVPQMSTDSQGLPSLPMPRDDERCHSEIGRTQSKFFASVLKFRRNCQKRAESAGAITADECATSDPLALIARAREKAESKLLERCASANYSNLDSCGGDLASLRSCVLDDANARATLLFQNSYAQPAGGATTTTTTTSTTSTTLGPQDPSCPEFGELRLFAGANEPCTSNVDCELGTCDPGLGFCFTATELDTGWTGISHDSDIINQFVARTRMRCMGPFDGMSSEPCGVCNIIGVDPLDDCRCANDNRTSCDEPLQNDADDCGGNLCNCYLGPPLPLSAGNVPVCVLNRIAEDVRGTTNVDTGASNIRNRLRSVVHNGPALAAPCPYCSAVCTAPVVNAGNPCLFDSECDDIGGDGVCTPDTPRDGIRNGVCQFDLNHGQPCDSGGTNTTFPAPTGGGHSLDCFPNPGANISGQGLAINLDVTTGTPDPITAAIPCNFNTSTCHCKTCSGSSSTGCTSNADCAAIGAGTCTANNGNEPVQNACASPARQCNDAGGGEGECQDGPDDMFCDGIVRPNGVGIVACTSNASCAGSNCGSVSCGNCTLSKRRECFLETITAQGTPDPDYPVGSAVFCIAGTSNAGINATAGLPGPGRLYNQSAATTFCASDPMVEYTPGVGGCP